MRSQGQISQQLKQVTFRHLQKRLRALFKQRPQTCRHNRAVDLDDTSYVHLCGVLNGAGQPRNVPCDVRIPGCIEMAKGCPLWEPLKSKADLKREFYATIQGDRGVLASEYPDVAALMWVLDDAGETPSVSEVETALSEAEEAEEPEPARSSWWPGFLRKLGGGE